MFSCGFLKIPLVLFTPLLPLPVRHSSYVLLGPSRAFAPLTLELFLFLSNHYSPSLSQPLQLCQIMYSNVSIRCYERVCAHMCTCVCLMDLCHKNYNAPCRNKLFNKYPKARQGKASSCWPRVLESHQII